MAILLRQGIAGLLRLGAAFGALSIWLIAAIVFYDVLLRLAGHPTLWALEVATYLMLAAAVMASGEAVVQGGHFAVRLLPDALSPQRRRRLDLAIDAACAGLLAFVSYGFLDLMLLSLRFEMNSPTLLQVPLAQPQAGPSHAD